MCVRSPAAWLALPDDATASALAQRFVLQVRCAVHDCADREDAMLVVCELVSNAVRHAAPPVLLQVHCQLDQLLLQVDDSDPATRGVRWPGQVEQGGCGLGLVQALSSSWGVTYWSCGKSVWARLTARHAHRTG